MKKLFYTIITIFYLTIIINPANVFAKKIQVTDIPNNSYVIGTHIFTEDMLLTTSHIMLGATTIGSDKLEDMIIYYKTPRGIWINGITGDKVTLPSELEITHKDTKKYDETILYGDVDQNGKIDSNDVLLIMQYVEGTVELTDEQKKLADVDNDGVIDSADAQVLSCYYVDGLKTDPNGYNITLPYTGHTKYQISMDLDGGKGSILNSYYNISLLTLQSPTKDGYVFIGWTGSNGTTPELEVKIPEGTTGDLTYKANWVLLGDVNQDGEITGKDVLLIMQYVEGKDELTDIQKKLADVDNDGVIDSADVQILSCYIVDGVKTDPNGYNITLPYTGHTKYKISMDLDGGQGTTINSYYNISTLTLQSPKKEGYVFIGWTGSNGDTPELEVKISSKTTGDLTYKANWILLGDADQNGKIESKDALLIIQYVDGMTELTDVQKKLADVDNDGVVDSADVQILSCYIVDGVKTDPEGYNITIPYTGHTKYQISTDLDGGQGSIINSYYNISEVTLKTPTKDGYVFIGWTGSNGTTPELDVKIPIGTTGDLTYKATWTKEN